MNRRDLLLPICTVVAGPRRLWAQTARRRPQIGILSPAGREILGRPTSALASFIQGLRDFGHVDAKTVRLEYRFAELSLDRLPALAAELVHLGPDLIYTHGNGAVPAARATATIPIVVGPSGERIMSELAGSLARPSGNVTGTTLTNRQWDQKCLQLLKEVAPGTRRVAVVVDPQYPPFLDQSHGLAAGMDALGITLFRIEVQRAADAPGAFVAIDANRADAIFLVDSLVLAGTSDVRARFIDMGLRRRLPLVSSNEAVAADGGLLSLGTDVAALGRRAAHHAHRILGGTKPGDLPIERPTVFKLRLNLRTAKLLGLVFPQALLLRADEVIR